jgi:phosphate transport system protein
MAKNLERIGDHATNIAENVHFLVNGTQIAGARRKGDMSTVAIAASDEPR